MVNSEDDKRGEVSDRRAKDRRIAWDPGYTGPDRRKGDRRMHERRSA